MSRIEVVNLNKYFGNSWILKDISADFKEGNIYGIVGRNGSGKTVLFKCICGLIHDFSGEIRIDGKLIGKEIDFPESIGVIIESPGFIGQFSAYQNLKYLSLLNKHFNRERILEVLKQVGLSESVNKKVAKFSMGMRQKLGIAQAIMEDPDILVLDEPMNGLDQSSVDSIRSLILHLKEEGKLIILASHNKEDIESLCDCVYQMEAGVLSKMKE
mgnify:CR=1 FL=1